MTGPLDNLNIDINDVDTSIAILPAGVHPVEIKEARVEENKRKDGYNLVLTFATLQEVPDSTGERTVRVGHTVRNWTPLQQSSNPDAPDYREGIAKIVDAVFGVEKGNRPEFSQALVQQMQGKKVQIRTTVDVDDIGARENVRSVLPMR